MNKKLILLSSILVLALFIISACEEDVGRRIFGRERTIPKITHLECQNQQCVQVSGYGANECTNDADCRLVSETCTDNDGDGYGEGNCPYGPDCDDNNANINSGTEEVCEDNLDNDCDGQIDEENCIAIPKPKSFCGDGILDSGEQCDDGSRNGDVCQPEPNKECTYCSSDCKSITVVSGGPYSDQQSVLVMLSECNKAYDISLSDSGWDKNDDGYTSGNEVCTSEGETCIMSLLEHNDGKIYDPVTCSHLNIVNESFTSPGILNVWCCSPSS